MSARRMKAVRLHEYGGPEVLRLDEVPVPEPGPGEVLVRTHAVGVNPPDWYLRGGLTTVPGSGSTVSLPVIPGTDVSGTVEALGTGVSALAVGDDVFGLLRFPSFDGSTYAEYVVAPGSDLARKPTGLAHVTAAGAPMAGLTAWQFLIDLGHDQPSPFQDVPHRPPALGAGTTVLVNGAAGGVGHFAVQLATWKGARVIAVASGAHEAFLRELGADEFIDYTKHTDGHPADLVRDVDVVLDTVGGPQCRRWLHSLRPGGSLFPVFPGDFDESARELIAKQDLTVSIAQVRSDGAQLAELGRLIDAGTVRVAIDSTFALAEARAAHERAARGHIRGKIVLTVAQS